MITKYKVPIDTLKDILISKDIKPSVQRLKILEYIIDSKSHPSVDEIFGALQPLIPTLSKTTVYNTVKNLTDKGLLTTIKIESGELRYDYFEKPHSHFKCRICGNIYDIFDENDNILDIKEIDGHKVEKVYLCYEGVCKKCLKKQ
jgi:Fe2+ or Zn2+ uptake regulation protein